MFERTFTFSVSLFSHPGKQNRYVFTSYLNHFNQTHYQGWPYCPKKPWQVWLKLIKVYLTHISISVKKLWPRQYIKESIQLGSCLQFQRRDKENDGTKHGSKQESGTQEKQSVAYILYERHRQKILEVTWVCETSKLLENNTSLSTSPNLCFSQKQFHWWGTTGSQSHSYHYC